MGVKDLKEGEMIEKKMVKKLTALDCIKESGCQDFETDIPKRSPAI